MVKNASLLQSPSNVAILCHWLESLTMTTLTCIHWKLETEHKGYFLFHLSCATCLRRVCLATVKYYFFIHSSCLLISLVLVHEQECDNRLAMNYACMLFPRFFACWYGHIKSSWPGSLSYYLLDRWNLFLPSLQQDYCRSDFFFFNITLMSACDTWVLVNLFFLSRSIDQALIIYLGKHCTDFRVYIPCFFFFFEFWLIRST